jgi:predicted dehydrogenase
MPEPIRVAVIGVGHLGSKHAKTYYRMKKARLAGVCDKKADKAAAAAKKYKCPYFTDYRELFDKVDAVSISVPTDMHCEIGKAFLSRGIHALIEKPICKTVPEADELIGLAKEKNLVLQIGHIERFNSAVLALEKVLNKPKFIECHRLGPFTERGTDVGVVLDLMIHDIDIVLSLINSEVKDIQAVGIKVLTKHEDIANVRLVFGNDAICNLTVSRIANKRMRKIRIFQEDAYLSLDYVHQKVLLYRKKNNKITHKSLKVKKEQSLTKELESFVDCIINGKRPIISGLEGKRALQVALNIQNSINANA